MTVARTFAVAACLVLVLVPSGCGAQQAAPDGGPTSSVRELQPCRVTRVVDGDTLDCDPVGRVRLLGVDTPESGQAPFGAMAAEALARLIPEDGAISLEADVENRDQYDRALRYAWVDGRMLNWALVRSGHAVMLTYPPNVQYVDWLRAAQDEARNERAGLWAVDGFACKPVAYRRGTCK
jgi:micrococcal nuclease